MAPRKKTGSNAPKTPSTVLNKLDMAPTLAHPNETVVQHNGDHSSEMLVTTDEQAVRLELKILKQDWPALCSVLRSSGSLKPLDLLYLALNIVGDESLFFSNSELLLIDHAAKFGSLDAIKRRSAALLAEGENLGRFVESQDPEQPLSVTHVATEPAPETDADHHGAPLSPTGQPPQDDRPKPVTGTPATAAQSATGKATKMSDAERLEINKRLLREAAAKHADLLVNPIGKTPPAERHKSQDDLPKPVTETPAAANQSEIEKETAAAEAERRRIQKIMKQNENMFPKPLAREP